MKEIRLHSRGGQGAVKAAHLIVKTVVDTNGYAHFIPFFGVERKGSPVYGFLRIDDKEINLKCQVYKPEVLIIMDDSLLDMPQTFDGMVDGATVVLNTSHTAEELGDRLPSGIGKLALVDATHIATEYLGSIIPNTAMLGAFVKATGLTDWDSMKEHIADMFGEKNIVAAQAAYDSVKIQEGTK